MKQLCQIIYHATDLFLRQKKRVSHFFFNCGNCLKYGKDILYIWVKEIII